MGISVYGSFEVTGDLDFDKLLDLTKKDEWLRDNSIERLIDVKNKEIDSIRGDSFYTEVQDSFFCAIQECLDDNAEVCADIECLEADYHKIIIITKNNIAEEDVESEEDEEDEEF